MIYLYLSVSSIIEVTLYFRSKRVSMKKIMIILVTIVLSSSVVMAEVISTYLIGESGSITNVKSKLKENGFEILATENNVITITNAELQASNTYVATLQLYVGGSDVRVQNPDYFGVAYLNDKYEKGQFSETINALHNALGELRGSIERLKFNQLGHYRFQMGMPYFDQSITVSTKERAYEKVKGNQKILYSLTLPNGNILVGHKPSIGIKGFLKTLDQSVNAQILPYESLVLSEQVEMMHPKFYLALSLPQLSMGQFMKISHIPGKIEKDIVNIYK